MANNDNLDYVGSSHTLIAQDDGGKGTSLTLTAKGANLSCTADSSNVNIESSGSDGTVTISAKKAITLQVGNSSLNITGKDITLSVQKFKNTKFGFWDSTLSLNAVSGATLSSGNKVTINGFTGNTITDGFGGTFKTEIGTLTCKGTSVTSICPDVADMVAQDISLTAKIAQLSAETAARDKDSDTKAKYKGGGKIPVGLSKMVTDIVLVIKNAANTSKGDYQDKFSAACKVVAFVADLAYQFEELVVSCSVAHGSDWSAYTKNGIDNDGTTPQDVLTMSLQCANIGALIAAAAPSYALCHTAVNGNAKLDLSSKGITLKGSVVDIKSAAKTETETALITI